MGGARAAWTLRQEAVMSCQGHCALACLLDGRRFQVTGQLLTLSKVFQAHRSKFCKGTGSGRGSNGQMLAKDKVHIRAARCLTISRVKLGYGQAPSQDFPLFIETLGGQGTHLH